MRLWVLVGFLLPDGVSASTPSVCGELTPPCDDCSTSVAGGFSVILNQKVAWGSNLLDSVHVREGDPLFNVRHDPRVLFESPGSGGYDFVSY